MRASEYPKMAALPGTGPDGKTCRACGFYKPLSPHSKYSYCRKRREMLKEQGFHLNELSSGECIDASLPACRYYEGRGKN